MAFQTRLKWKDPRRLYDEEKRGLTFLQRVRKYHLPTFLAGFAVVLISLVFDGLPQDRGVLVQILVLGVVLGLAFVVIYGLASLASPTITIRDKNITRVNATGTDVWWYKDLSSYGFGTVDLKGESIRTLQLRTRNDEFIVIEIAPSVSVEMIDHQLSRTIGLRQDAA